MELLHSVEVSFCNLSSHFEFPILHIWTDRFSRFSSGLRLCSVWCTSIKSIPTLFENMSYPAVPPEKYGVLRTCLPHSLITDVQSFFQYTVDLFLLLHVNFAMYTMLKFAFCYQNLSNIYFTWCAYPQYTYPQIATSEESRTAWLEFYKEPRIATSEAYNKLVAVYVESSSVPWILFSGQTGLTVLQSSHRTKEASLEHFK